MATLFRAGVLEIDSAKRQVRVDGREIELEPKAFAVLIYLVERRDRVVSKEEIFATVWPGVAVTDNALTRVVAQLRRRLGDDAKSPTYIETIPTAGYRFIAEMQGAPENPSATAPPPASRRWLTPAVLFIFVAVIVVAVFVWRSSVSVEWPPSPRIEQITSTTALDLNPSFSPDARHIVFSSNRSGRFQLYVRAVSGGSDQQLTDLEEDAIHPSWSPDGRWIAFVMGAASKISVMPADGGPARVLAEGGVFPAWSPDSTRLVYRAGTAVTAREVASFDSTQLMVIPISGGPPRELTRPGAPAGGHNTPTWMRDGRVLFCASLGDTVSQPWTVDPDSGDLRRVATVPTSALHARISPDGNWLYFTSHIGLMRMRLPNGKPQTLIAAGAQMPRDLTFSSDGSKLIFSQATDQATLWRASLDGRGEAKPFTDELGVRATYPAFSYDGRYLAYSLLRRGSEFSVRIMDAAGGTSRPITAPDVAGLLPSWTDKGEIGFMQLGKGGPQYTIQPLKSPGRNVPLQLNRRFVRRLRLSPDGEWLAGNYSEPGKKPAIFVASTATGEARIITPADRDIAYPTWSRDSRWLAAEERSEGKPATRLVVLPRDGGIVETIVSEKMHNWPNDVGTDSDTIVFSGLRQGIWNIYAVSRRTKEVRQVTKFQSRALLVRYPTLTPGMTQVVFEYGELKGNIYLAELK